TVPATFTDDLTDVLDDAMYDNDGSPGTSVHDNQLTWSGSVAIGQTVAVTYSFTVRPSGSGNGVLLNLVTPGRGGTCSGPCQARAVIPLPQLPVTGSGAMAALRWAVALLLVGVGLVCLTNRRYWTKTATP